MYNFQALISFSWESYCHLSKSMFVYVGCMEINFSIANLFSFCTSEVSVFSILRRSDKIQACSISYLDDKQFWSLSIAILIFEIYY